MSKKTPSPGKKGGAVATTGQPGRGQVKTRVKRKKGRTGSSQKWLQRHVNDPYVREASRQGYRSRSAFKILQIQDKFRLFKPGQAVLDLGAAPGGWSQVILPLVGSGGQVVAVDLLEMEPLDGLTCLVGDLNDLETAARCRDELGRPADVVLSDMAANTTGHDATDHLRTQALAEVALDVAKEILAPGGCFVCKVFQGGAGAELLADLRAHFETVKHMKPEASRKESPEMYVVALNFRSGEKA